MIPPVKKSTANKSSWAHLLWFLHVYETISVPIKYFERLPVLTVLTVEVDIHQVWNILVLWKRTRQLFSITDWLINWLTDVMTVTDWLADYHNHLKSDSWSSDPYFSFMSSRNSGNSIVPFPSRSASSIRFNTSHWEDDQLMTTFDILSSFSLILFSWKYWPEEELHPQLDFPPSS